MVMVWLQFSDILLVTKYTKQYTRYKIKQKLQVKDLLVSVWEVYL